jgi:uridine kinase
MKKALLIGIAGASAAGKTLCARKVLEHIDSDQTALIQEDSYYKDLSHISFKERATVNFDHPAAFDHALLLRHLASLLRGEIIEHPVYDYTQHVRLAEKRRLGPAKLVLLDGILILSNPELRALMDLRVFIDTPLDLCFIRRLKRDISERGRAIESVISQYQDTVRPMYHEFIKPSQIHADIIIPQGGHNTAAIEVISAWVNQRLELGAA